MPCSAITLSLATICSVVSVALVGIAFGTDNWLFVKVNRLGIEANLATSSISADEFFSKGIYYSRTKGLFRTCYPEELPPGESLYLSLVETQCQNIDYHIFDSESDTTNFSTEEMTRLHMARAMIAMFIVSFFFVFISFFTGVAGCWTRSPGKVAVTAIFMLFSCLFAAAGMGFWHGVEFYEDKRLNIEPFQGSWSDMLQINSTPWYDWSYMLAWVGTGTALLSFCLFLGASQCIQTEQRKEHQKQMQYVMPVYAQKQQYANYGYGYPAPNYPYASPQYGHYNY